MELSGTSINLNAGQGTGTPTLKMDGTTIVNSSRSFIGTGATFYSGTTTGEISIGRNSNLTCTKIAAEQMIATVKKEAHQELSVDGCQ